MTKLNKPGAANANTLNRRTFVQQCVLGAVAISSGTLMGCFAAQKATNYKGSAGLQISLNNNWLFGGKFKDGAMSPGFDDGNFKSVNIPHTVTTASWQDWNEKTWQDVWIYRKHFTLPDNMKGMRLFLQFDGVMVNASANINGHSLPTHTGGYLPFEYEVTEFVKAGDNIIALKVDSAWSNVPPQGSKNGTKAVDYLEMGGIHRSVSLKAVPKIYIKDVFVKPVDALTDNRHIALSVTVDAATLLHQAVIARVELIDGNNVISSADQNINVSKSGQISVALKLKNLKDIELWHVDHPKLYTVVATLLLSGQLIHNYIKRTGIRDAQFKLDGFYLNGTRLQLFGLNRHEIYPYVGFAMPARVMRKDAEILKYDFHCNIVRCSHYPQNDAFLDACDELGLLVWEEVPGWQYIGDEAWKNILIESTRDMVMRDRSRPSVIIWGTRVNESANDEELYKRTRAVAKALDGSRPTSGSMTPDSRKDWEQNWHEEVFAFDDYHAENGRVGILPAVKNYPYFLAEAVGQFNYPAGKYFNAYYRRSGEVAVQMQQALNHAQAHDKAAADPRNGGVIAWCAFEYSSLLNHYRHVKYPGVADVFRIPKLGASFYLSQGDPKKETVIHPNFYWDFGPKTPNGPGKNVAIFSNCDELKITIDNKEAANLKPDRQNYPNLKHAPFFTDLDYPTDKPTELKIDGYINGTPVCSRSFLADHTQDQFSVTIDDKEIIADGSDATRVVFRVTDKFGAARPYSGGKVSFKLDGPGILVGDNPFNLTESGGAAAVWIRTLYQQTGVIKLNVTHDGLGMKSLEVRVVKE